MSHLLQKLRQLRARFTVSESGVVMTEALLAVPFLTLFSVGLLEFGAVLWQREQIETGLRDAARYVARCRTSASNAAVPASCLTVARNLAYHATVDGTGPLRVSGWNVGTSNIVFTYPALGAETGVTATTTNQMISSPMFGMLDIDALTITLSHSQRRVGW